MATRELPKQEIVIETGATILVGGKHFKVHGSANKQGGLSNIIELEEINTSERYFLKLDKTGVSSTTQMSVEEFETMALILLGHIYSESATVEIKPLECIWSGKVEYQNVTCHAILTKKLHDNYLSIAANLLEQYSLSDPSLAYPFVMCLVDFVEEMIKVGFASRDFKFDSVRLQFQQDRLRCVYLDANIGIIKTSDGREHKADITSNIAGSFPTVFPILEEHVLLRQDVTFELEANAMRWACLILACIVIFRKHPLIATDNDEHEIQITMQQILDRNVPREDLQRYLAQINSAILSRKARFAQIDLSDKPEQDREQLLELYKTICAKLNDILKQYSFEVI